MELPTQPADRLFARPRGSAPAGQNRLLLRALGAFLVLPGMVAFVVPLVIGFASGRPQRYAALAAVPIGIGGLLLALCVREFLVAGRGTLAPWDPPRRLVTSGPYRFSRNPIYLGVLSVLIGWCVLWESHVLEIYLAVTLGVFLFRVLLLEEPWAAERFGTDWQAYRARTPRWLI
jgi:protein-S-isoprenylcysteine O-methyltransferase Ste14